MRTLEEVIKALEICTSDYGGCEGCPYNHDCKPDDKWDDALHHLKEYKEKLSNDETTYKRGYSRGYAKAKEDEAVSRRWEESYRESQMPWNRGCEMGG